MRDVVVRENAPRRNLAGHELPTYRIVAIAGSRLPMQVLFQKDRGGEPI